MLSGVSDVAIPVLGELKFGDVSLEERSVAMVTVVLSVLLHKVLHEVHRRHVLSAGQQVAGEPPGDTQGTG